MKSFIFTYKFIHIFILPPITIVSVRVTIVPNGYLVFVIDRWLLAHDRVIILTKNRLSTNGLIKITLFDRKIFIFIAIFSLLSIRV